MDHYVSNEWVLLLFLGLSFHGNLGDKESLVPLQGSDIADVVLTAELQDRAHSVILTVFL